MSKCIKSWLILAVTLLGSPAHGGMRLPDGGTATYAKGSIAKAWYGEPTSRYDHGALGDAIEAGSLTVQVKDGTTLTYLLDDTLVFEDITPRLFDLDKDGTAEVITILSSLTKGASIGVFAIKEGKLIQIARSPFIGTRHRWLNIAAIDDFGGDGRVEIAVVKTPHIGGPLQFWRLNGSALNLVASSGRYSNHPINTRKLGLSATVDFDGDGRLELIVPAAGLNSVDVVALQGDRPVVMKTIQLKSKVSDNFKTSAKRQAVIPLEDGSVVRVP